jgi:hypothetical protein
MITNTADCPQPVLAVEVSSATQRKRMAYLSSKLHFPGPPQSSFSGNAIWDGRKIESQSEIEAQTRLQKDDVPGLIQSNQATEH